MRYTVISELFSSEEAGEYTSYGIAVYDRGKQIHTVSDISLDKDKMTALAQSFNDEALELEQLPQAIEDFLYDFEV